MPRSSRPTPTASHTSSPSNQSETSAEPRIVFTKHDTFQYKGITITFDRFRRVMQGLVKDAQELLWKELLFCDDDSSITSIDVSRLTDGLDDQGHDHRFLQNDSNCLNIAGGPKAILDSASASPSLRNEISFRPGTHNPVFSLTFQIKYQSALHIFLKYLFAIIHTTGGLPMTDRQVLSIRYINNGSQIRQLYLHENVVMIVTPRGHLRSSNDALPRFLPPQVSQMVIAYLTTVVPFLEMMDLEPPTMLEDEKGYLFDYFGSGAWLTLPMAFSDEFKKRLGIGIDADDFRRIALAIAEKKGLVNFNDAAKALK